MITLSIGFLQVEYTGKIHEIAHVAREQVTRKWQFWKVIPKISFNQKLPPIFLLQRREYKSKFLEVETEASRTKDRLEMMNHMLDEMQEKMWENTFYQNDGMMTEAKMSKLSGRQTSTRKNFLDELRKSTRLSSEKKAQIVLAT